MPYFDGIEEDMRWLLNKREDAMAKNGECFFFDDKDMNRIADEIIQILERNRASYIEADRILELAKRAIQYRRI